MKSFRLSRLCLVLILVLVGCGGDDDESDSQSSDATPPATENVITAENANQVIEVLTLGRGMMGDIAVSPDSRTLAVTTTEGVWLYDLATGSEHHPITSEVELPVFSTDGTMLAGVSDDEQIGVWSLTGEQIVFLSSQGEVDALAFSPDGRLLVAHQAVGSSDVVTGWAVDGGDVVFNIEDATSFTVAPNSQTLAVGMADGILGLVDDESGEITQRLEGHSDVVTAVAFSPDGLTLLSGSDDKTARLWDMETGQIMHIFETDSKLIGVTFAPDGQTILTTHVFRNHVTQIWDIDTGEQLRVFETALQVMPDSETVYGESRTGELGLWDITTGEMKRAFIGHSGRTSHQIVVQDGRSVISAAELDGTVRQWDVATGETTRVFEGFSYANAMFAPDGHSLLQWSLGLPKETLDLWDIETGTVVRQFSADSQLGGSGSGFGTSSDFSSDGRWLASGSVDGEVVIWDVESGDMVHQLDATMLGSNQFVRFAPDDRILAAVTRPRGIIWNVETGEVVDIYETADRQRQIGMTLLDQKRAVQIMFLNGNRLEVWPPNGTAALHLDYEYEPSDFFEFSLSTPYIVAPDGRTVLLPNINVVELLRGEATDEDRWQVWDSNSGDVLRTFSLEETVYPYGISFSYDSHYLMFPSIPDNRLIVVDVRTGETIQRITVDGLTDAVWSPVNHVLAVATDEQVRLFDGVTGEELWSIELPQGYGRQVIFSPTGDYFMTVPYEILFNRGIVNVFGVADK